MTNSSFFKRISCIVCLVWWCIVHTAVAVPALKSGPGIEIMPAAFSQDGKLNFVVVGENNNSNNNNQLQQQAAPSVYQAPVQAQEQFQYEQPQVQYQQPQYQQYYQPDYQEPEYEQPVQYPAPTTYYSAPPTAYAPYSPPQARPYYSSVGPIGERGGFSSGPSSTRYSPFGSLGSSLTSGASLLGAALLFG